VADDTPRDPLSKTLPLSDVGEPAEDEPEDPLSQTLPAGVDLLSQTLPAGEALLVRKLSELEDALSETLPADDEVLSRTLPAPVPAEEAEWDTMFSWPDLDADHQEPEDPRLRAFGMDRLDWVRGWGMSTQAPGYLFQPSTLDQVRELLELAGERGAPVTLRGAGRSYGDAALCPEAMILDLQRFRRILSWDPEEGILEAEPGVSLGDVWRYTLGDGWWPPVVSGTMRPTLGGCLAMNIHGKNNWRAGTVGDHCLDLDVMLPSGKLRTVSRDMDPELFHGLIGSFGQLGVVTRVRCQMKKVESGLVEVRALAVRNLEEMLRLADDAKDDHEYVVGWIDAFARGKKLGRGQLHLARHLTAAEDHLPAQTLRVEAQDLPETFFGMVPRSIMWRLMKPWTNRFGMAWVNGAKFYHARTRENGAVYRQSLAAFSFLLDYVPGWRRVYLPGGLIQHQSFVPVDRAHEVFQRQLEICRRRRMPSFLAVLKRHRPDPFLLGHGVDGFSLALDFPVTRRNRAKLWNLVREIAEPVVEAGGRFYPAKDAALPAELYRATFRDGQLKRFAELEERCDPEGVLTSSLARRLLG
jgi:decaprenylphospho-beta-D-ribofuranose 2-oxidase